MIGPVLWTKRNSRDLKRHAALGFTSCALHSRDCRAFASAKCNNSAGPAVMMGVDSAWAPMESSAVSRSCQHIARQACCCLVCFCFEVVRHQHSTKCAEY